MDSVVVVVLAVVLGALGAGGGWLLLKRRPTTRGRDENAAPVVRDEHEVKVVDQLAKRRAETRRRIQGDMAIEDPTQRSDALSKRIQQRRDDGGSP